jgi:D-alanyl-D-alanine carboxypeptidase/D-alanyl-D-alanine-endopeptidase (penicillin-binding protein 4)
VALTPDLGYYSLVSSVSTTEDPAQAGVGVHRDPGDRVIHVDGWVAENHPYSTELAIEDPPLYAAIALRHELQARGIAVDGAAVSTHEFQGNPDDFLHQSREPLSLPSASGTAGAMAAAAADSGAAQTCRGMCPVTLVHTSAPLSQDVTVTLKESQNLHAEVMLRRLGVAFGEAAAPQSSPLDQGARVIRQFLINAGLSPDDFVFFDGSGLSAKDLVTPRATAQLLAFATRQPWFAAWKASLPIAGVDGTLASRFAQTPLQGHIFAKTGTLGESRALSGYVDAASGRQVIFSIFADDHSPADSSDHATFDKIVAAIAANE